MHSSVKKILALALALCLALSIGIFAADAANSSSFIVTTPTGYTSADDVQYVYGSSCIANWGARGEVCTFLSKYAQSYYGISNSFEKFSQLAGGTNQSNASQSDLYKALQTFMRSTSTHQTSYNETRDLYKFTDCLRSDTSHISSFYSGKELKGQWDGGSTWNREHTWPNSKGMNGNDENDIMMLRPTWVQENSSRGNTAYGESSGYYDPGLATHGDCARIALYVYVRWGNTGKMWGAAGVIENLDILLKWMAEDPVDTWEMGRNDAVQSITGVRNVFIDYPELAWLLFGKEVPASLQSPSRNNASTSPVIPVQPTNPQPTEPAPNIREYAIPVFSLTADSIVFLYHDQSASVMTSVASGTGLKGITGTKSDSKLGVTDDMLGLSVSDAGNGYYTLRSPDGKYLTAGESGKALTLEASKTDCSLWTVNANGILNYGAKYSGKDQYLEYYNDRFTTYGLSESSGSAPYTFHFFALESSLSVDPGPTPTEPPVTEPVATDPIATQPVVTPPTCSHIRTTLKNAFAGSCTKEGYTGDTCCTDCGKLLSQGYALPMQEHVAIVDSGMEATCIQPGKEGDTVCKICGTILEEGAEIPATGNHPFGDWKVTKAPTATEAGKRSRICAVCDLVETEAIPATGSAPTEPAPAESVPAETVPQQTEVQPSQPQQTQPQSPAPEKSDKNISTVVIASGAVIAVAAGVVAFMVVGKRRKKDE